jgi:hypothetical protein
MPDRPRILCLMSSSVDGGLHASRYTASPDGTPKEWSAIYEALHDELGGDAWLVGRKTMAEMAKGEPHPPAEVGDVDRRQHFARRDATPMRSLSIRRGSSTFAAPISAATTPSSCSVTG